MVLNQNGYTMASLDLNYQKPPLFLLNQTHPFLIFLLKVGPPIYFFFFTFAFSFFRLLSPSVSGEAAAAASLPPYFTPPSHKTKLVHTHILITIIIKLIFPTLLLRSSSSGRRTAVTGDGGVDAVGLPSLSSFSFLPFFLSLGRSVSLLSQSFSGGFLRFPARWAADGGGFR